MNNKLSLYSRFVGNMVTDRMQGASVAKTSVPSSTDLPTQQAVATINGQVLPGAVGGVGSGFMPLDTSYNGNVGLFGVVGGVPTTLDAVTSTTSVDALAASRVPYSASSLLFGPSMGLPDRERPIMLADAGGNPENTLLAWRVAAGQIASDAGNYVKGLANTPTQFVNGALALGHATVRGGEAIGLLPPGAGAGSTPQIPYFQTDGGFAARSGNAAGFALTMFEQIPAKAVAGVTRLFDAVVAGQEAAALGKASGLTISSNPATGNPAAIARGMASLNTRQATVLEQLPEFGSKAIIAKNFGQNDLAALTAATGDEFAMFTTGGRRLVFRGNAESVPITPEIASNLAGQGWRWSSHTHPGFDTNVLRSSLGDQAVLGAMGGNQSAIFNSLGQRVIFTPAGNSLRTANTT
ncbi:hypothetical protein GIY62_17305 [Burkholderia plantarii]|uniref:hypothetical protein n=1 Tax=Burkholderia plantarii TaxID=41899 RepID=UPI002729A20E|nr:hypothetical protein [Burkholderia plantarii]WLE58843.1 hypothetical protein GIY62_17305 [Burkholderia plantarii]